VGMTSTAGSLMVLRGRQVELRRAGCMEPKRGLVGDNGEYLASV
jgi:hypothetical protein